jgi:beta-N-acetylhexosaminidase
MKNPLPMGPVMLDLEGLTLSEIEIEKLQHPNTGAVILFARNYADPEQVTELCRHVRSVRKGPLLIAVDQEGGRVQRFQHQFTRLPAANYYANAPELTEAAGWLMATELLAVGVDFSFAPVLDVDSGISSVIGNRAFGERPEEVCQLASAFSKGMRKAGMAITGKHFPGHGGVATDSHVASPEDSRSMTELNQRDLLPFKQLINEGLDAIMPAHVIYSAIDPHPAGFSSFWLKTILRGQLQFKGTIFSDDLSMEGAAIAGDYTARAKLAQSAGCDMLLVCNNPKAAEQVLEQLPITTDPERTARLLNMCAKRTYERQALLNMPIWQEISSKITQLSA